MTALADVPTFTGDGGVHVVVETPRGSAAKFRYDEELAVFTLSRPLAAGLVYPYDWGYIPRTRAGDGDPLDAMVLWDCTSYPGIVLDCRPFAVVNVEQTNRQSRKRERNDRVLCVPRAAPVWSGLRGPRDLPDRTRVELAHFFEAAVALEGKQVKVLGWSGARAADALVRRTRAFSRQ